MTDAITIVDLSDAAAKIERLHKRVLELEAELAMIHGSFAPRLADDEPARFTYDIQPNAPR